MCLCLVKRHIISTYGAVQVRIHAFSIMTLGKGELPGFSRRSLYAKGKSRYLGGCRLQHRSRRGDEERSHYSSWKRDCSAHSLFTALTEKSWLILHSCILTNEIPVAARSAAAHLLGLRVRIPPGALMSVVSVVFCR